jgi:hypothetical protein
MSLKKHANMLACSPTTANLSIADLETLHRIAFRTIRLQENLSETSPRCMMSATLGVRNCELFEIIPETNILLTFFEDGNDSLEVACWDVSSQFEIGEAFTFRLQYSSRKHTLFAPGPRGDGIASSNVKDGIYHLPFIAAIADGG